MLYIYLKRKKKGGGGKEQKKKEKKKGKKRTKKEALDWQENVPGNENLITAAACQRPHEKEMEDSQQRKLEMSCGTLCSFSFSFAL